MREVLIWALFGFLAVFYCSMLAACWWLAVRYLLGLDRAP